MEVACCLRQQCNGIADSMLKDRNGTVSLLNSLKQMKIVSFVIFCVKIL